MEIADRKILIDCGHSVFPKIKALGLETSIDYLLITHTHDDHVGSLASLILYAYYHKNKKFTLLCPTEQFRNHLREYLSFSMKNPDAYLNYEPLSCLPGLGFINTTGLHVSYLQSFAYVFEDEENRIIYSGDNSTPQLIFDKLTKMPAKNSRVFHDISFNGDSARTSYKELEPYSESYEVYGYHTSADEAPVDNKIPLVENMPELLF